MDAVVKISSAQGWRPTMDEKPHDSADLNELRRWIRTERKAKQRDRYRVVLLALEGLTTAAIMDKLVKEGKVDE